MKNLTIMLLLLLCSSITTAREGSVPTAAAEIIDGAGRSVGRASFIQQSDGVVVTVEVSHLPPGPHGVHVHEKGKCDPPEFMTAGAHFNPTRRKHGVKNPRGMHAGDLPNLIVGADGKGKLDAILIGASLGSGPTSLVAPGGTAIVIHENEDDEKTDPSGNSGERIACGVIVGDF